MSLTVCFPLCCCSTYNYMGSVVNGMLAAFEKGDVAQARKIQVMITQCLQHNIGVADVSNRSLEIMLICEVLSLFSLIGIMCVCVSFFFLSSSVPNAGSLELCLPAW